MPSLNSKHPKNKSRKVTKYKLLLDEGLFLPKFYPKLNAFHSLKHIAYDLKMSGIKDKALYELAIQENRILIVFNVKDFKKIIKPDGISVIDLSTNLSNKEADLKILKALKDMRTDQVKGYLISITKSGIEFKPSKNFYLLDIQKVILILTLII
ncbi:DUF5615 family PIN-like protein [Patescibacteria group bacterium]|nr:DUF5615 family PIN-like protein [Patescibacteria group bacterium]